MVAQPGDICQPGRRGGVPGHDETIGGEVTPLGSRQDVPAARGRQHHGLGARQGAVGEDIGQGGAAGVLRHGRGGDQQGRLGGRLTGVGPGTRHTQPAGTERPAVEAGELLGDDARAGHRRTVLAAPAAASIDRWRCVHGGSTGGNPRCSGGIGKHAGVTIRPDDASDCYRGRHETHTGVG